MGSYYNTERGNKLASVAIILLIFVSIVVPARVYVRTRIVRCFGPDDWAIVLATVIGNASCSLIITGMFFGFGSHIHTVSPDDYKTGVMISWILQLLYIPGICTAKISVSLFIRRISPYKTYVQIAYVIMTFMIAYTTIIFFFLLTQCLPFAYIWDKSLKGKCLSSSSMNLVAYAHSASNIFTDFALLVLVITMFWKVQMPRRQKYAVYGVFGLGTFAGLASVVKFTFSPDFGKRGDYLYDINDLALWSVVEIQAGIVATSLPTLKPLARKYFRRKSGSSDLPASNSDGRPYPLRDFALGLISMDSESEQHIVYDNQMQALDTLEAGNGVSGEHNATEGHERTDFGLKI